MKTNNVILGALCFCLGFTACSTDDFESKALVDSDKVSTVSIGVKDFVFDPDATTRTDFKFDASGFSFEWSERDTLGIYPETGDQTYFAIPDEAVGKSYATFDGGGWLLRNGRTNYGYYPFSRKNYQAEEYKNQIQVSYEGQSQTGNNSTLGLGKYDFMATRATSADVGKVDFMFEHLGAIAMIKVNAPVEGSFTKLRLTAEEGGSFMTKGYFDMTSGTADEIPILQRTNNDWYGSNHIELLLSNIYATLGDELTFYMMIPPTESISKLYLTLLTNDSEVYTHDITFGKQFKPGLAYFLDFREALGDDYELISPASEDTFVDNGVSTIWTVHTTSANCVDKIDAVKEALHNMHTNDDKRMITLRMPDVTTIPANAFNDQVGWYYNWIINLYAFEGENVKVVGEDAFYQMKSLARISLPNVEIVSGFRESGLTSVSLPNAVTLKGGAFSSCTNLTTASLPKVVTIEDGGGFGGCTNLTSVYMPIVETLGNAAFQGCSSLTYIDFPETTEIGQMVFCDVALTSVNLPKLTTMGYRSFAGCSSLKTISLPSLTTLTPYWGYINAFEYCTSLESFDFPRLEEYGNGMFNHCTSLTEVNLPNATLIGASCFYECTNLTSFSAAKAKVIGESAFDETALTTVDLPKAEEIHAWAFGGLSLKAISLPSAWRVDHDAFSNCRYLNTVSLPSLSQTNYRDNGIGTIKLFEGCLELQTIHFGDYSARLHDGINPITDIDTTVFDGAEISGCTIYLPSDPDLRGRLDVSGFAHVYVGGVQVR